MIYRVTWSLIRSLFRLLWDYTVRGAENVPAEGPVILAANHVSYLDPPVVGCGIWRPAHFMAKEELFRNPVFGRYIRALYAFPVRRGAGDRAALKHSLEVLERGEALVLFPEGTRSPTGELQEPEMGVGLIACRTGAPVVPVYIEGTRDAMAGGKIRRARIRVTYGRPLWFRPEGEKKPGRDDYETAARRIMQEIAALRDA